MLDRNRQKACEPGSRFGPSKRLTRGCVPSFIGKGLEDLLPGFSRKKAVCPTPLDPVCFRTFWPCPLMLQLRPCPQLPAPPTPGASSGDDGGNRGVGVVGEEGW